MDDSTTLAHSDSFELLLPDDEALNEMFGNSFDEIIPEEIGVDMTNSEEVEEQQSITVVDDKQAINFPPWKVQRLMLDLKGLSVDAGEFS